MRLESSYLPWRIAARWTTTRTTAPLNSISLDSGGLVRNGKNNADKQRKFAKATASRISAVCSLLILGASWLGAATTARDADWPSLRVSRDRYFGPHGLCMK